MTPDPTASLAALAEAVHAAASRGLEDLYLERLVEVWWRRGPDGSVTRHTLLREGSAARFDGTLRSSDGTDRLAIAELVDLPARAIPPAVLPPLPPVPELDGWPVATAVAVRWRWSVAALLRDRVATRIERPALAELTDSAGRRELSLWPPTAAAPTLDAAVPEREARVPDRACPVLLAPGAAATLVHEVVGHRLEADVIAGRASAPATLGEPLFDLPLDVTDDPGAALPGSFTADDEGLIAAARRLLVAGRVAGVLADRRTAAAYGVPPGNARRGGVHAPPRPRISNLVTAAPGRSLASLRREARIEVEQVEAGTLESAAGVVWLAVTRAWLLRRGRPVARLAPFTLRGSLTALRAGLLAASRERRPSARPGWCRKHGEVVPTGAVTPWLLVEGLVAS